jgi:hypothetical protein
LTSPDPPACDVDGTDIKSYDLFAKTSGLDRVDVGLGETDRLHKQDVQRLAGGAGIGVADLVALEILQASDRRIRFHGPDELADGEHVVADDVQVVALLDGRYRAGEIDLAIVKIAAEQVADGGAAAAGGEDAGDVRALFLEETLLHRYRIRHTVGGDTVIAHHNLLGPRRASECKTGEGSRQYQPSW